jgi:hypothetical protein
MRERIMNTRRGGAIRRLLAAALLALLLASCAGQGRQSTRSTTSAEASASTRSSSPLGHHCLSGSNIEAAARRELALRFEVLKNCYFADRGGIRSQEITVEVPSGSRAGMYRVAKAIRDSGGAWTDTTVIDFVRGTGGRRERVGRAYVSSLQFGGDIVLTLHKHR